MKKIQRQTSFKIDWILVNEIALGKAPQNEADLLFLKNENIKSILNLCNEEEIKIPLVYSCLNQT